MKLGILTFHCAHNYGAVLQCYALQEYLKLLGHDVYVIDYRPQYLTSYYKKHKKEHWQKTPIDGYYTIKSIVRECIRIPFRHPRYKAFQNFIDSRLRLYPYSEENDFSDFDAVILGSDQIWNPKITGGDFDPVFFGEGLRCKKIVYAASNKNKFLSSVERDFYSDKLSKLDYIGVRESTLQHLLQPLTLKTIHLNLDPTLLAGDILFENLSISQGFEKKYVMIYEIISHTEVYNIAKAYASEHQYKIVELNAQIFRNRLTERDQIASPEKWVRYIKHAELVVTTSFHGVAFSILLKKNFYYVRQNNPSDYRIDSLLQQLNLMDRIIEMDGRSLDVPIDYNAVHIRLNQLREDSISYLYNAL